MISDKEMSKLKKLLALAGSDNENEAALAMKKAEEIMRKHNLSVIDVAQDGSGAYIKSADVTAPKRVPAWVKTLAASLAETFDGKVIINRRTLGNRFTFVAGATDLAIIVDLFERLQQTVRRMSTAYVQAHRHLGHSRTIGNSYRTGLVFTISERLEKMRENCAPGNEKNACGMTGKELMIVKSKAVEQRYRKLFPHARKRPTRHSIRNADAFFQGKADGHNVSLHRSVGGSSQPQMLR